MIFDSGKHSIGAEDEQGRVGIHRFEQNQSLAGRTTER